VHWPVGYQFAENDGVAVIIQDSDEGSGFWENDQVTDWKLLMNDVTPGGKVPV